MLLWFDVGIKRYTTINLFNVALSRLWFDVGIKRYTTTRDKMTHIDGCGLM